MTLPSHFFTMAENNNGTQTMSTLSLPPILHHGKHLPPLQNKSSPPHHPSIQKDARTSSSPLGCFLLTPTDFEPFPKRSQPPIAPTKSKKKSFRCDVCHHTFTRLNNLKSHLTTHASERPFKCTQCHQDFRRQYDLKRHLKLHTGEKPFLCTSCSRSFARSDALHRHQRLNGTTCHPTKPADAKPIQNDLPFVLLPSLKSEYDQMKESLCTLTAQYKSQQDEIEALKSACHDLQVENRVLSSLVMKNTNSLASKNQ
ncbi:hypothetical protein [Absidia glauca]|uniref:C2H2-type domain-containing protein n=1 Tax=Absidia glauca TaxID=4829 RepID=A0A168MXW6_ABSGL|nr:hypothetical protein [Absidia glauca]